MSRCDDSRRRGACDRNVAEAIEAEFARMGGSMMGSWRRSSRRCVQRPNDTWQRTRGMSRAPEGAREAGHRI
jgi:hypothetical protein